MERITGRHIATDHWQRFIRSLVCRDSISDSLNYFMDMIEEEAAETDVDPCRVLCATSQ
jgi:hypothetical protein